jgi:antitoxin HicB
MKKDLKYYMSLSYKMEIIYDKDDHSYVLYFPELRGCMTSGKTAEAALKNAADAKENWIMSALADKAAIPEPLSSRQYSGQFKLRMPKQLHRVIAERAEEEGISMNQFLVYTLEKDLLQG